MKRVIVLLASVLMVAIASGDPTNLEGGVFIAHHPPDVQFSAGTDWCEKYVEEYALTSCEDQNNRIDLDGNQGESSVWYVLAAWTEEKTWCGTEFGFGEYDPDIYGFLAWGPCSPGENLEIATEMWPGPSEGTALTTTDTPWTGDIVPVYYFAGYAYYEGVIALAADPATDFGGTCNCATPPESWSAADLGGMGLFSAGTYVCPGAGLDGGEGGPGGPEDPPGGHGAGWDYAEDAVIIRFAPDVISFPQDREVDPPHFLAPLSDASIALPALRSRLEELGAETFATLAPSWRHLNANPSASVDLHGNPVELVDFTDVYRVTLSGVASVNDVLAGLGRHPGIVYVEPDLRLSLYSCPPGPYPDDPHYEDQWYLNNTDRNCIEDPHHYWDLNVPEAWELCDCCGFGTKIGILDDGVNGGHEELEDYVDTRLSLSFVEDLPSWNVAPWGSHGTSTSSLAAAATHNALGLASLPHLPAFPGDGILVALRLSGLEMPPPSDETTWSRAASALDYVCGPFVNRRVGVVSNSWGIPYHKYCYHAFCRSAREAFRNAYRLGISLVCCAGNNLPDPPPQGCEDPDSLFLYPAAFPDYCLAVAGINCHGETNPDWHVGSYIDMVGPVGDVWVVSGGTSEYEWLPGWQGTSLSAPVIAGAIALLLGEDPSLTNEDCYALLKLSADDMGQPAIAVGKGIPRLDRAMGWLTSDCRVVHGFTTEVHTDETLDGRSVQFRNVEGVTVGEDTWEEFWVVPHRLETVVWLPSDERTQQVWARGRGSSGWRLIDEYLDGNPTPPPRYDGLFYDTWARIADWNAQTGECLLESYTYRVQVAEDPPQWVWVPFDPEGGEGYRLQYSYVCCGGFEECVDVSVVAADNEQGLELRVIGSPVSQGGSVHLRFAMPGEGKVWLEVYGPDGRRVQSLVDGARVAAGSNDVRWDLSEQGGRRAASGVYFLRLRGVLDERDGTMSRTRVVVVR